MAGKRGWGAKARAASALARRRKKTGNYRIAMRVKGDKAWAAYDKAKMASDYKKREASNKKRRTRAHRRAGAKKAAATRAAKRG